MATTNEQGTTSVSDARKALDVIADYVANSKANEAPTTGGGTTTPPTTGGGTTTPPPTGGAKYPTPAILMPTGPRLSSPAILSNTTEMKTSGQFFNYSNKILDPKAPMRGIAFKTKGGTGIHIPKISLTDMDLSGGSGVLRIQEEEVDELYMGRIKLLRGVYAPGVIAGILLIGHGIVHKITMEDIEYDRAEAVTNPGDIYAGLFTGGGHGDGTPAYGASESFTLRRCKISNYWAKYDPVKYPGKYENSDGFVAENSFKNGLIEDCEFRHGSDAGIDRKSPNTVVKGTVIEDNRENLKTWVSAFDVDVYSMYARHAHNVITPQKDRLDYHAEFTRYFGKDPSIPLFEFQRNGGNIVIKNVDTSPLPEKQVLATVSDKTALGSTIQFGDKTYTLNSNKIYL